MTAFSVPENLAFDDYDSLVAFLNDWMDRSDLEGSADSMIALAESRMRRELSPMFYESADTVDVTDGYGTLPSDCDFVRQVAYAGKPLREVSPETGRDFTAGETPVAYSLEAGRIYLWPSTDVTVDVTYQAKPTRLSEASPNNTLLSQHPDLYFYGCMMFAEGYVANDRRASLFKALWDEAVDSANRFFLRQRRKSIGYGRPWIVV